MTDLNPEVIEQKGGGDSSETVYFSIKKQNFCIENGKTFRMIRRRYNGRMMTVHVPVTPKKKKRKRRQKKKIVKESEDEAHDDANVDREDSATPENCGGGDVENREEGEGNKVEINKERGVDKKNIRTKNIDDFQGLKHENTDDNVFEQHTHKSVNNEDDEGEGKAEVENNPNKDKVLEEKITPEKVKTKKDGRFVRFLRTIRRGFRRIASYVEEINNMLDHVLITVFL